MAPKVNGIIKVYEPLPLSDINADRQRNQYTSELLQSASQKLDSDATGPRFGKRHVQMIVYFLLMFTSFCVRVNMSVAIVAMTDPNASINKDIPTYNWTDKNVIQSSFFWGYIFPQVSAGWLASRFGPKWFLIGTMGVTSVAGLLLPTLAATFDSKGVMFCRALQGFCQGFVFPSVHGLLAKWVPSPERSRLGTFVYIASPVGTVVCMLLTGYISAGWYGWPMALYLFNGLGLVWCLMFAYIGCNSPAVHPTISREERFYIENSLGQQDSTKNSLLSSLPYFVQLATGPLFSCLSDAMINKGICSIATTRKIMNFFGLFVPGIALAIVANIRIDQPEMAVVLLVSAVAFNSACMSGFIVNHMDLSPNHAGILMGISNAISHCCAIMALLFAQYVVTDEGNIAQWKIMFYSAAGIYMAVTILFFIFGSGTTQPWNDEEEKPKPGA
ncbi:putative inorganic phosphate cotransporter isoform X5 [Leptinotarsa decemlineata]|uniref:putative inorganic phosphate cotransporter isoform X5 n=1 Tax=Leptinotarsa decemlineata TaxID=7539 RepID=UPI003D306A2C